LVPGFLKLLGDVEGRTGDFFPKIIHREGDSVLFVVLGGKADEQLPRQIVLPYVRAHSTTSWLASQLLRRLPGNVATWTTKCNRPAHPTPSATYACETPAPRRSG